MSVTTAFSALAVKALGNTLTRSGNNPDNKSILAVVPMDARSLRAKEKRRLRFPHCAHYVLNHFVECADSENLTETAHKIKSSIDRLRGEPRARMQLLYSQGVPNSSGSFKYLAGVSSVQQPTAEIGFQNLDVSMALTNPSPKFWLFVITYGETTTIKAL